MRKLLSALEVLFGLVGFAGLVCTGGFAGEVLEVWGRDGVSPDALFGEVIFESRDEDDVTRQPL
jgi:hypothetical protein